MTNSNEPWLSTDRQRMVYAMERAKVLFGGYRRGDANDPETYVASIAAVLAMYDPELVRRITDPRTGISTSEKFRAFMPNSGELKAYCDEHAAIRDRHARLAALPAPDFRRPLQEPLANGCRARLFVRADAPGYDAMVERARDPKTDRLDWKMEDKDGRPGIWVNAEWWEGRSRGKAPRRFMAKDFQEMDKAVSTNPNP